jgi:hypothetical protein
VEQGYVASLARPGANVTGVTSMTSELSRSACSFSRRRLQKPFHRLLSLGGERRKKADSENDREPDLRWRNSWRAV